MFGYDIPAGLKVLLAIIVLAGGYAISQTETAQVAWDNFFTKAEEPGPSGTLEVNLNQQESVLAQIGGAVTLIPTSQLNQSWVKGSDNVYRAPVISKSDKGNVDLTSTEGPTHPSQIAKSLQKASDAEMMSYETPGYRLAEDAEGYPFQTEVEAIVKWANWNSDNSENRGGDLLGEAKSRHWALYQSTSVDDDSYYIKALNEDYEKVRLSFKNGDLKSGWDFPSEDEPVPTIKEDEPADEPAPAKDESTDGGLVEDAPSDKGSDSGSDDGGLVD